MADPIELDITVRDEASETIDAVADKAAGLEKQSPVEVAVDTTGVPAVTEDLTAVEAMRKHISESPAMVDIQTNFAAARADLEQAQATVQRAQEKFSGLGQAIGQLGLGDLAGQLGPVGSSLSTAAQAASAMTGPLAAIGPLAVVAAVGAGAIRDNMKEAAEVKALNVQNVSEFADALRKGATAAETLRDRLEKTGEVKVATLIDGVKDITPALAKAGITVEQFTTAAGQGKAGIDKLGEAMRAAKVPAGEAMTVLQGAVSVGENLKEANERAAAVTKVLGDAQQTTGDQAATAAGKQDTLAGSTDAAAAAAAGAKISTEDYVKVLASIPPDKRTEINAAIARGDLAEAVRLLNAAAAGPYNAVINVAVRGANVGGQIGQLVRAGAAAGGGQVVSQTVVNLPAGARGVDALREVTGAARRSGTRYGSAAVSRARR